MPTIGKTLGTLIGVAVGVLALFVIPFLVGQGYKNQAINLEEQISADSANIEVIVQKRVDQLTQLVNAVKDSKEFEHDTLVQLTEARTQAEGGNIEQSNITLNAVAEAYPELKTIELYDNLMTATSTVENQLSGARTAYNESVKEYNKLVRQFPNSYFLNMAGYDSIDYPMFTANGTATDFDPGTDNLFEDN